MKATPAIQYKPLEFSRFEWLTFDCYGTLIDWEAGILSALRAAFPDVKAGDADLLREYSELEPAIQSSGYKKYRAILAEIMRKLGAKYSVEISAAQADSLADSIKTWQPFPDTVAGLRRLKHDVDGFAIASERDERGR